MNHDNNSEINMQNANNVHFVVCFERNLMTQCTNTSTHSTQYHHIDFQLQEIIKITNA